MSVIKKISFILFLIVVLLSLIFAFLYLFSPQFMSYHSDAVGLTWPQVDKEFQILIIALMRTCGGGWLATMIARSGTPLIHALNTGLACWGLSQGVHHKRWLRAVLAYGGAVALHGLWNVGAVGLGLAGVFAEGEIGVPSGMGVVLSAVGAGILVVLSLLSIGGLLSIPQRLKARMATGD